jgi:hypothetical protein
MRLEKGHRCDDLSMIRRFGLASSQINGTVRLSKFLIDGPTTQQRQKAESVLLYAEEKRSV